MMPQTGTLEECGYRDAALSSSALHLAVLAAELFALREVKLRSKNGQVCRAVGYTRYATDTKT